MRPRLKFGHFRLTPRTVRAWRSPLVVSDASGLLSLDTSAPDLAAMRRNIRDVVHPRLVRRAQSLATQVRVAEFEAARIVESRRLAAQANRRRHALVHVVPDALDPAAVVILDVEARTFAVSISPPAPGALDAFDVVVGLDVRNALQRLGVEPSLPRTEPWRLVDLSPPRKTLKLNKQGRKLDITTDLLLRATTGLSLGEPDRIAAYLQGGDQRRLAARLEADAKALYAFYAYGRSHGYVRLRWGFVDENLGVSWALPGEPGIRDTLEQAHRDGLEVEVVLGGAPGWTEPWSRAQRARVVRARGYGYAIEVNEREWPQEDVQAVRLVESPTAPESTTRTKGAGPACK